MEILEKLIHEKIYVALNKFEILHYDPYKTRNFFLIKYSLFAMFIINPFRRVIRCNKSNILKEINFRIAGSNFPKQLTSSGKLSF